MAVCCTRKDMLINPVDGDAVWVKKLCDISNSIKYLRWNIVFWIHKSMLVKARLQNGKVKGLFVTLAYLLDDKFGQPYVIIPSPRIGMYPRGSMLFIYFTRCHLSCHARHTIITVLFSVLFIKSKSEIIITPLLFGRRQFFSLSS